MVEESRVVDTTREGSFNYAIQRLFREMSELIGKHAATSLQIN
jgi:hypothetical protein